MNRHDFSACNFSMRQWCDCIKRMICGDNGDNQRKAWNISCRKLRHPRRWWTHERCRFTFAWLGQSDNGTKLFPVFANLLGAEIWDCVTLLQHKQDQCCHVTTAKHSICCTIFSAGAWHPCGNSEIGHLGSQDEKIFQGLHLGVLFSNAFLFLKILSFLTHFQFNCESHKENDSGV